MVANKLLTLVLIRQCNRVLLGYKKKGFGVGRWNGFGGKVEQGETIQQAAARELHEECGVEAHSLEEIGLLKFEFVGDPQWLEVHVFTADTFKGEPTESEEMRPQWYNIHSIPFNDMWPDDKYWFPIFLKGAKFSGYFKFEGHNNILKTELKEVEKLHYNDYEHFKLNGIV
ncbi:7,8-dihydro-8-oxoguanine triphosphatase [Lingula anatina]|uniref:Oxidized purine nucleoside triphosphate hydrolase n=1 Tax=Lingula anatina TaxID=7574 RepID=A0A1S3JEB6_LINAN|nr:7,8-dihydro-8-oxoguanine triphosphatase [Lingula anatina]XP_013408506.1 7,8-dihydro-8-oxoguanine triphosphatase [Lingula anatina]|eukprot:XP_013408505.1 7,8-dihydro-8-oxoguanine triphosphatase [Lingula anatina]